ncbi:hypothetical protein U1Q18_011258 [Sarracenia purpurea var. burkii]
MDSGNSGSLQSSSGGEEFDSRVESSMSAFLNPPPPPPHHHSHHPNSSMFDPLSNYFNPLIPLSPPPLSNPNPVLHLDPMWFKTLRSIPNSTDIDPFLPSSTSSLQPLLGGAFATSSLPVLFPATSATENITPRAPSSSAATDRTTSHVVRNPRKRSRASRRVPTTVLTTDTTNFRAMVQEFTGIPAPPFTSSFFPRTGVDLFGAPSSIRSNPLGWDTSQPPYHLLRPLAQKLQPQPPFVSSSYSSSPSSTLFSSSMQNPILTFHSLLQSAAAKYPHPLPNPAIQGSKTREESLEIPSNDPHLKMAVLDDFGLSNGKVTRNTQLAELPHLVSSEGTAARNDQNPSSWAEGMGSYEGDRSHLRSVINGSYDYSRSVTNDKSSYSASSSEFHGGKASENVPTRVEGMVESWICSSDH